MAVEIEQGEDREDTEEQRNEDQIRGARDHLSSLGSLEKPANRFRLLEFRRRDVIAQLASAKRSPRRP
jgi:hypothetical protein